MLKKILIGVGVLAVIGIVAMVVVFNKFESAIQEKVPEFRQYVTMTTEEQNAYVEKNFDNLMQHFMDDNEKDDYQAMKKNPEVYTAMIDFGRSVVATFIVSSEVYKELDSETKAKIKAESDLRAARNAKLNEILNKYSAQQK